MQGQPRKQQLQQKCNVKQLKENVMIRASSWAWGREDAAEHPSAELSVSSSRFPSARQAPVPAPAEMVFPGRIYGHAILAAWGRHWFMVLLQTKFLRVTIPVRPFWPPWAAALPTGRDRCPETKYHHMLYPHGRLASSKKIGEKIKIKKNVRDTTWRGTFLFTKQPLNL